MLTSLKTWKYDNGAYVSPPIMDANSFKRIKRFLIRSYVTIDVNEKSRIIRIPVGEEHEKNLERLKHLRLVR